MKLRNKLILSCAALAAVATTAVSTTYAWYTSNREVTAGTVTGKTASNGDDLLLISRTGVANSWSSSVNLNDVAVDFIPVYKAADGKFYTMGVNSTTKKEDLSTETTSGFITFDLYFKSGNDSNLTVNVKQFNLTVANNNDYLAKSTLTTTGLGNVGATYSANLLRALTMEMSIGNTKEAKSGKTPAAPSTSTASAYQFDSKASGDSLADSAASGYNAHTYYNAVLGTSITEALDGSIAYRTATTTESTWTAGSDTREDLYKTNGKVAANGSVTGWSFGQTGSGTASTAGTDDTGISILKVHFEIYLDGWDKACFDACQGQNIALDMVFESPLSTTPTETTTPETTTPVEP